MDAWKITHIVSVSLFLSSFLAKVSMTAAGKYGMLEWYGRTFRRADMMLSFLFLGTGIYLWSRSGFSLDLEWFLVKLGMVLAAVPVGIIGIKKQSPALSLTAAGLFLCIFILSLIMV